MSFDDVNRPWHMRNDLANLSRAFYIPKNWKEKWTLWRKGWRPFTNGTHWHKPSKRCRELIDRAWLC